ncbi:MAG: hypothetical protein Q7J27_01325 [Syntrophales bacterium]|nr:hypothetical protein [Syntrophales bacterium]
MIILPLISGCTTSSNHFAEKDKHLLGSRRVGYRKQTFQSQPCVRYDFTSEETIQNFQIVNGKWQIKNGKLWAVSGEKNRSILLAQSRRGPLRIELEVTNYANPDGSIGDITILINSENFDNFFGRGYALTTGSYYNNCTTFYRLGKAIAKTEYSPLVSGKTYRVLIELIDGHIRYWLNDKIILEAWDSKQLELDPNLWIGIRTWNTRMSVDWFAMYQGIEK